MAHMTNFGALLTPKEKFKELLKVSYKKEPEQKPKQSTQQAYLLKPKKDDKV